MRNDHGRYPSSQGRQGADRVRIDEYERRDYGSRDSFRHGSGYGGYEGYGEDRGGGHGTGAGQGGPRGGMDRGDFVSPGGPRSNWVGGSASDRFTAGARGGFRVHRIMPKGYQRSDERIHDEVCQELSRCGEDVSDVSVEVKDGCVTLEGTVEDRQAKHIIEDCADDCLGVKDVDNRIRVMRPVSGGFASELAATLPEETPENASAPEAAPSGMKTTATARLKKS